MGRETWSAQAATWFSGRIEASHLHAMSLVCSPRSRFRPINSAKTTARVGASETGPHERPAVVISARKVVPASIDALTFLVAAAIRACSVSKRRCSTTCRSQETSLS